MLDLLITSINLIMFLFQVLTLTEISQYYLYRVMTAQIRRNLTFMEFLIQELKKYFQFINFFFGRAGVIV